MIKNVKVLEYDLLVIENLKKNNILYKKEKTQFVLVSFGVSGFSGFSGFSSPYFSAFSSASY